MPSKDYRTLCTKIGITVLINTLLLQTLSSIVDIACKAAEGSIRNFAVLYGINADDYYYAFTESAMLFTYLASFLIPAFIFMLMTRKSGREPMRLGVRIFPNAPAVILSAIGIVVFFAYINSIIVSFVDFSAIFEDDPLDSPIKILLAFISIAIVPAFAEEFLFRGCVLSNLLPYGKTGAIVFSALLFSLMHGNFAQFLYTFAAGIVLGIVYVETGSIWTPTFIHLFNNFYSLIQQIVYERFGETQRIGMILTTLDFTLIALGAALGGWLLYYRKKKGAREGFAEPTKKIDIDKKEAKRGFFRPIIIVHIVVSVLLALMIVALALAYPYLT